VPVPDAPEFLGDQSLQLRAYLQAIQLMSRALLILPAFILIAIGMALALPEKEKPAAFRAGAAVVDISPQKFPVRVNGMFTERTADKVVDPLTARALALDDGTTRLVICVVDTCMMPRDLIDAAKKQASEATGIPADRMLVSATHTHSAPSAMGCLGSRVDPEYAAFLPGRIAQAMVAAVQNLQPARAGWTAFDDWDHTHNRRWIRRPDRLLNDPFGQPTVRANMHPGYQSADVTGPSGPVDPQISLLAVETAEGKPLALLANYSMHYQSSPMLSSDYFGRFAVHIGQMLGANDKFVGMMSQGTSGDLWSGDYSGPAKPVLDYGLYAREIAERVAEAYKKIEWHTTVPLAMAESTLTLNYRVPDEARLKWAREVQAKLGDKLPQSQAEIYALEAIHLHEGQKAELKLQALRIGDLGISALPNEVFCLTGLKLKARSPFPLTMNIELANGAEGYIPPSEQHALGGYTTWPARTAGLEVQAEAKITAAVTALLEKVSGKPARQESATPTDYSKAVTAAGPVAYWRMEEMDAPTARDATGRHDAVIESGVAVYLPGFGEQPRSPSPSRACHFAGGRIKAKVPLSDTYSVSFWLWNGLPTDSRLVTGYAFSRGADGDKMTGEHFGIGGTYKAEAQGRLILFNGNAADQLLIGKTKLALKDWHHVVLVREGKNVRVHLDGKPVPDLAGELPLTVPAGEQSLFLGGRSDNFANWEGKLDEAALFPRALTGSEASQLYQASKQTPPSTVLAPDFPPLPPEEALKSIHVPEGFKVELVACEPNVIDPVAIDWDLAGRLWVIEMADYPNGMDNNGKPGGRVRVLEDTDGDGRYEKSTLFAEGLNFPTGLLAWRDGVIVTAAPDVLFLKDTNGDGKADSTEKLISGLSEGNQQLRANGLRWGLDGRVYCAAGGHHGGHAEDTVLRSHKDHQDLKIGSRDFSFDPDSGDVRAESGPSQFGRNRDDAGHWFGTQNSRALWHYVLPDQYLRRNPHVPAPDPTHLVVGPLNAPVYPVSPPEKRFHSFENANHFTSACSGMIYRDELLFPRRASELDAFTCEPFHNLVQHNILVEDGVTWKARRAPGEEKHDFFASTDRWCRPVMTRTGPDGALWVVDMYRYMIEHPAWLPENGRAELLPHYRLGDDKGRIYRVFRADKPPRKVQPMDKFTPADLVKAMDSPNEWQRDKAHMTLEARGLPENDGVKVSVRDAARELLKSKNPLTRIQAIWFIKHLSWHPPGGGTLKDPDARVRENAIRADEDPVPGFIELADDPSIKVRLQFALSAGDWPHPGETSDEWGQRLGRALTAVAIRDHADPWMRAAVLSSAMPHCRALCEGIAAAGGDAFAAYVDGLTATALGLNDRESLAAMLRPLLNATGGRSAKSPGDVARFLRALTKKGQSRAGLSATPDKLTDALRGIDSVLALAQQALRDSTTVPDLRIASAELLVIEEGSRPTVMEIVPNWLSPDSDQRLQYAAVHILASTALPIVSPLLLQPFASLTPRTREAIIDALLSREPWSLALLEHVKANPSFTLDATQRARFAQHSSKKVRDLAARVLKVDSSRKEVLDQYRPALQLKGDAARGKIVFARCIACHKVEGQGLEIGPDLKSVAGHPAEKLLTNIIDPSLDVQPGFFAFNARLKDGGELYGLITSETGNSVSFKLTDGSTKLVLRSDLADLKSTGQSLMPAGLEAGMTTQEMADLIAWLTAQK
jgi:putative membrane-bound dehydrogenase-like protein